VSIVVALGVTLVGMTLVGVAAARSIVDAELATSAPADLHLAAPAGESLPPEVVERVRGASEVTAVRLYRSATVEVNGIRDAADITDLKPAVHSGLQATSGSLDDIGPGGVAVPRYLARAFQVQVGGTLTLAAAGHSLPVRVVAIAVALPLNARILADTTDLDRLGVPSGASGLLADAARRGESGRTAAVRAIEVAGGGAVQVLADQRDVADEQLGSLLAIGLGLVGMTVIVAVVGVGTTTALSVVERLREAGLLRAIGLSRGGLRAMLTAEAALYGVVGSVLGLALSIPYTALLFAALDSDATLDLPVAQLGMVVVALTALTALAGVLPAWRASRISPMAAVALDG
jgi:putative ABC transport system permease protein